MSGATDHLSLLTTGNRARDVPSGGINDVAVDAAAVTPPCLSRRLPIA